MSHIPFGEQLPGILGPLAFRPETARPLTELAETLLRGPSPLSSGERELIAAWASKKNHCVFCSESHGASAQYHLRDTPGLVRQVLEDPAKASISPKLRALLGIAEKVTLGGAAVAASDMQMARAHGATDVEIHDTVLIAAAFCMYNRYVDGLATLCPPAGSPAYAPMGEVLATQGYLRARPTG